MLLNRSTKGLTGLSPASGGLGYRFWRSNADCAFATSADGDFDPNFEPAMYGPAAEALLKGAEYGAETEDAAGSSDAAAAAGVRPPRLVDWGAGGGGGVRRGSGRCGHGERGEGFGGNEVAATVAGGAVQDGPVAAAIAEHVGRGPQSSL